MLSFTLVKVSLIFQELTIDLDALINRSNWCREKRKMEAYESIQMLSQTERMFLSAGPKFILSLAVL